MRNNQLNEKQLKMYIESLEKIIFNSDLTNKENIDKIITRIDALIKVLKGKAFLKGTKINGM
jgi:hypothetical protein